MLTCPVYCVVPRVTLKVLPLLSVQAVPLPPALAVVCPWHTGRELELELDIAIMLLYMLGAVVMGDESITLSLVGLYTAGAPLDGMSSAEDEDVLLPYTCGVVFEADEDNKLLLLVTAVEELLE